MAKRKVVLPDYELPVQTPIGPMTLLNGEWVVGDGRRSPKRIQLVPISKLPSIATPTARTLLAGIKERIEALLWPNHTHHDFHKGKNEGLMIAVRLLDEGLAVAKQAAQRSRARMVYVRPTVFSSMAQFGRDGVFGSQVASTFEKLVPAFLIVAQEHLPKLSKPKRAPKRARKPKPKRKPTRRMARRRVIRRFNR